MKCPYWILDYYYTQKRFWKGLLLISDDTLIRSVVLAFCIWSLVGILKIITFIIKGFE